MSNPLTHQVAEKVAAEIARSQRSARFVARESGIPTATFDRKIHGRSDFSLTELITIARVLNVDLADFVPTEALHGSAA